LVLEELATLSRRPYSVELRSRALSNLRPYVEEELEALETLEWLRDLTAEELARRRAYRMLLSVAGHGKMEDRPANERILEALRLEAVTSSELQELTGASAGTVRNNLCQLVKEGKVVAEGGYPKIYRLARSAPEKVPGE
jgi:predicted Rossmann fold nucleotide-binding protein DprA/Smf involved in DNA uptake